MLPTFFGKKKSGIKEYTTLNHDGTERQINIAELQKIRAPTFHLDPDA